MSAIHLVRHGESEWNVQRRVQGQTMDVPLSALGRTQAAEAGRRLSGRPITALLTSDQARAAQTATVIGARLGIVPAAEPRLREQGLGSLEGLSVEQALLRAGELDWTDPDVAPGGGETIRQVYQRVSALLVELAADAATSAVVGGGDYVLVSHGDTIRVALAVLDGIAPEAVGHQMPANGSITTRPLD